MTYSLGFIGIVGNAGICSVGVLFPCSLFGGSGREITPITHIVTPFIPISNLVTKSP